MVHIPNTTQESVLIPSSLEIIKSGFEGLPRHAQLHLCAFLWFGKFLLQNSPLSCPKPRHIMIGWAPLSISQYPITYHLLPFCQWELAFCMESTNEDEGFQIGSPVEKPIATIWIIEHNINFGKLLLKVKSSSWLNIVTVRLWAIIT